MMAEKIDNIEKNVAKILEKMDEMPEKFVPRKEFEDFKNGVNLDKKELKQRVWEVSMKVAPWLFSMAALGLTTYVSIRGFN